MGRKKKATDDQILAAYREHGGVWRAGAALGMCGQAVHQRLVKLGASTPVNLFTPADDDRLVREYMLFRDAGQLDELARSMGRTKHFICRQARRLGLTDKNCIRPYHRVWKGMSEEAVKTIFDNFRRSSMTLGLYCKSKGYDDLGFSRTMKEHFPGEWDAVIEAKAPEQTMYRLGRSFEYRARDDLRKKKFFVLRSPRSQSPTDLVALRIGVVLMVQCKRSGALGPKEWNELFDLATSVGAVPVMAEMPGGRGIRYWRLIDRKDGSKRRQPMVEFDPETCLAKTPAMKGGAS